MAAWRLWYAENRLRIGDSYTPYVAGYVAGYERAANPPDEREEQGDGDE